MSLDVPSGWMASRLGHVASIVSDRWEPGQPPMPYVGLEHLGQGTGKILEVGHSEGLASMKTVFRPGDVLFGKLRPNLKKSALASFDGIASTDILVLRGRKDIDPKFLSYVAASEACFAFAVKSSAGTKMPRTSWSDMADFQVALPPLPEQRRIAEILSSVDEAIQATEAVIEQTRKVRNALSERLFSAGTGHKDWKDSAVGRIPESWHVCSMLDVSELISVGIASSATHAYRETGVPLLRNQNIKVGFLDLSDILYVSAEYDDEYASKRVRAGDIVTIRTGYPGRSAVIPPELNGCQTFTTLITRPRQSVINSQFLCEWINSERGMHEVRKRQAGGAQQNLNAGVLKTIPVPVPPMSEQVTICDILSSFPRDSDQDLQTLRSVKLNLMSDLLTGRKRVTDTMALAAE